MKLPRIRWSSLTIQMFFIMLGIGMIVGGIVGLAKHWPG